MGRKLSGLGSSIVVNCKETVGSSFTGKMTASAREVTAGQAKYQVYEFSVVDTDMNFQKKNDKGEYADVDVKEGEIVSVFAPTSLHKALQQAEVGETIKFVYKGLGAKKKGKNAPHIFDAEVI